jgi:iron(III) transport system ATP-binding protein
LSSLRIENVSKSFGANSVLRNISLSIDGGEFVSLLGPSGCGKTTLFKLIAGLQTPDSGSIFIGGACCDHVPARKRGAVIVFQDYGLFPHMTVTQNIEFGLMARKMSRTERAAKSANMLELVQLGEKARCYPHELSGGQKQRVALARACVLEPNVLLLDEPFSNLDTNLKEVMREFVLSLQHTLKITTILVTHDKEEAFMTSQRVAVIFDGSIQQFDTPLQIYSNPLTRQVADFIGEANYIEGTVYGGVFTCPLGHFDAAGQMDGAAQMMLRYGQIVLGRSSGVPCTVIEKKYKGCTTEYRVAAGGQRLTLNSGDNNFEAGQQAFVRVIAESLVFFD